MTGNTQNPIDQKAPAPAQQKPVAHLPCCGYTDTSALQWNPYNSVAQCHNCGQVYTSPQPARQPLTDEQIIAIADNARAAESGDAGYILPIAFAHAIEAAHGITREQQGVAE